MIRPFTENRLRFINFFFNLSFSKNNFGESVLSYKKELDQGVINFKKKLIELHYKKDTVDFNSLTYQFKTAQTFRSNKKLVKYAFNSVTALFLFLCLIIGPFAFNYYILSNTKNPWLLILTCLISISLGTFILILIFRLNSFLSNFEIVLGKSITRLSRYLIFIAMAFSIVSFMGLSPGLLKNIIYTTYHFFYVIIGYWILRSCSEIAIDMYYFSKKIQITQSLIVESSYQLARTNWKENIKQNPRRQSALSEIERLACLIEKDWSNHIIPGDEKTNTWKNKKLKGIAEGLRSLKQDIIIPSENAPETLEATFNSIFQKILKHDIKGLIGAEVPVTKTLKKSKLKILQSFIVAILPLSVIIILKNYPLLEIPQHYFPIGFLICGGWFLISLLIWLDPNLADKISTAKSFRSVLKNNDGEE